MLLCSVPAEPSLSSNAMGFGGSNPFDLPLWPAPAEPGLPTDALRCAGTKASTVLLLQSAPAVLGLSTGVVLGCTWGDKASALLLALCAALAAFFSCLPRATSRGSRLSPAWYVEAQSRGQASLELKPLIMCRMESVDTTVVMPSLLASSDARVDLPHPLVPQSNTITGSFPSRTLQASVKSDLWWAPLYWYSERVSQTTSAKKF